MTGYTKKRKTSPARKKVIPTVDRADITANEFIDIVRTIKADVAVPYEDASDIVVGINAHAYFGIATHTLKTERQKVLDAAHTLKAYLDSTGYPMEVELAQLHINLESAMRTLTFHLERAPVGEPYWVAAITTHVFSCDICIKANLEPGMSRASVAVRITSAVLTRLGYSVTPGALELFFQQPKVRASFKTIRSDLQNLP